MAAFIRAKNDVMSSSLRSSIAQVEPTEQDLARYRQRIVALMPNLNIPASEFDPPSPRAVCAMSLAMADAIIKGNDSDVRLFAAMNSQQ